ncbi:MAG TPA: cytochrome c oxidase subunit II, partial [Gemmatimonadales bacterium]
MTPNHRPRRLFGFGLAAVLALALAACSQDYPNSTFNPNTDLNADIDFLFDRLMFWGTIVFVLVEVMLVWTIIKFRRRDGKAEPKQIHGHTLLEILWTAIPALILVFIAVPTVRTIFRTQAPAAPGSLQVEVIGHQWWWEFRYPELGIVTANEIYVPHGRTVNFALKTQDVLHSFWIPQMGGKRDLISNRTNYMWFTPDSTMLSGAQVWNGFCAEFCGVSHANMKFRVVTVSPEQFDRWVAHQKTPAAFGAQPAATAQPGAPGAAPGP